MGKRVAKMAGLAIAAALAVSLAACGSQEAPGGEPPLPDESTEEAMLTAAWLGEDGLIGLVTYGSSSCLPQEESSTLAGGVLTVELVTEEGPCTMDYVPQVTLLSPEGVDPTSDLTIEVKGSGEGQVVLPALGSASGGDEFGTPLAGWTTTDDTFLFVTWGSSTCLPVVENIEASGDAEVTVTFVEPAPDQVCTADLAPQPQVGFIEGLNVASGVELVLNGAGFEGDRLPIVGHNANESL